MSLRKHSLAALIAAAGIAHFAPAQADVGSETAELLNLMYQDTRKDCGSSSRPAFLCSGVLLRGTTPSTAYDFYSISPNNQARGGVSVSYLRKDSKFKALAYGYTSGFIFDSVLDNPADHQDYKVLCAFPIDAATNERSQNGCGDSPRTVGSVENFCDQMGITTAEQWLTMYRSRSPSHSAQCGFDVRQGRGIGTANAFYQSIRAMGLIADESFKEDNELILSPWAIDPPRSPSILASFFADPAGREGARLNQIQWYRAAKQFLPAVSLQLPQTLQQDARFTYSANDQAILPTTEANQCGSYIKSAVWSKYSAIKYGKQISTLKVEPTDCGRRIQAGQTNNFFNELVSKYYLDPAWANNPDNHVESLASMRRQLVCQLVTARQAPKWSLEPIRSNVSHAVAIASGNCDYK